CPLLAVSEVGDPMLPTLGADIDIRTDVPRYRVYRDGELAAEPTDITALWRDDFVTFVIGCSFSFEEALLAAGVPVRHIQMNRNVPMYRTSLPC
ncbi:D-glutamate cyclase family protein, partial [Klebsiella pneumoniae]|uniref:D-glutamate cyclase family protein n=1 Tax=Klebsiella pneumoniae TaxID=573 RepID=UPI003854BA7A